MPTLSRRHALQLGLGLAAPALLTGRARAEAPKFKTVNPGFITIAMSGTMPSSGYIDGKITGSDSSMIEAIAKKMGLETKPNLMAWSATVESIKTGRADIMCGDMGFTPARANAMLLTDAIYYDSNFITMKKSEPDTGSFDMATLKGKTIGTGTGYSYVPQLKAIPGIVDVKLYDTVDACLRDLLAGRIDYAMLDSMNVDYVILQNKGIELKQVPVKSSPDFPRFSGRTPIVTGMSLDNPDLFDAVNAGVAWLWRSKTNVELMQKNGMMSPAYFMKPEKDVRIGVDRAEDGKIIGPGAHTPKDYSALFA